MPPVAAVVVPVLLALVALLLLGPAGPLAVGAAVAAAALVARTAHRRLGGLTGDVLGAGVETALLAPRLVRAQRGLSAPSSGDRTAPRGVPCEAATSSPGASARDIGCGHQMRRPIS